MIYGIDYLAGAKYPELILKEHPKGLAAGFFSNVPEFGDAFPIVQKLAQRGDVPLIRVHLQWSDQHLFSKADVRQCMAEAKRYEAIHGHSRIELSPFCEHNIARMIEQYYEPIAAAAPSCCIVNTPWKGSSSSKYRLETHGEKRFGKFANYSFDGSDALAVGKDWIREIKKNLRCDVLFLWTPLLNLRRSVDDATPRAQRTVRPTKETIQKLAALI